jgi:hypothetical protein
VQKIRNIGGHPIPIDVRELKIDSKQENEREMLAIQMQKNMAEGQKEGSESDNWLEHFEVNWYENKI